MKCVLALLAVVAAAYAAPAADPGVILGSPLVRTLLPGPAGTNGLVAYSNGAVVPVDEPSVAIAKANHIAAKIAATPVVVGHPGVVGVRSVIIG